MEVEVKGVEPQTQTWDTGIQSSISMTLSNVCPFYFQTTFSFFFIIINFFSFTFSLGVACLLCLLEYTGCTFSVSFSLDCILSLCYFFSESHKRLSPLLSPETVGTGREGRRRCVKAPTWHSRNLKCQFFSQPLGYWSKMKSFFVLEKKRRGNAIDKSGRLP